MKKLMAVYDADTRYAERLSDYVNRKEKGVFTAQAFTSKEKLAEYAKKRLRNDRYGLSYRQEI